MKNKLLIAVIGLSLTACVATDTGEQTAEGITDGVSVNEVAVPEAPKAPTVKQATESKVAQAPAVPVNTAADVLSDSNPKHDKQQITQLLNDFLTYNSQLIQHKNFWADELVYTSSSGTRFGKAAIIEGMSQPSASDSNDVTTYSAKEIDIRLHGNVAVLAFKLVAKNAQGKVIQEYFNTGTMKKISERWQAIAWQATKIPTDSVK